MKDYTGYIIFENAYTAATVNQKGKGINTRSASFISKYMKGNISDPIGRGPNKKTMDATKKIGDWQKGLNALYEEYEIQLSDKENKQTEDENEKEKMKFRKLENAIAEKQGASFRNARKKSGISQDSLGKFLYCSNKTISRWECGEPIPINKLKILSEVCDDFADCMFSNENHIIDKMLSESLQGLTFEQKRTVCKMITAMKESWNNKKSRKQPEIV